MSLFDLSGRTALVTGATQGLGLAILTPLAEQGAKVIVSERDGAACARTAAMLREAGHQATRIAADLVRSETINTLCDEASAVNVLGCNVGCSDSSRHRYRLAAGDGHRLARRRAVRLAADTQHRSLRRWQG